MSGQAEQLQQTMTFFKLDGMASAQAQNTRVRAPGVKRIQQRSKNFRVIGSHMPASFTAPDEEKFIKF